MTISLTIIAILAAAVLVAIYALVAWAWRTAHPADGRTHRSRRR